MLAIFPTKLVILTPWSCHSGQAVFLAKQLDPQYWPHMALNRHHWFLATSQAMKRCFLTCTWLPKNTFL
ncbi:putative signal peptide protein [Puccinia sorghi]|uniref:Putative signal peptide protein n=1 Tax=Puccinia sorghi TaxID=27349 RepID=A0A0L6V6E5_9BASI|nr:putative signal peptide protein [Puccinia sorghi]